MNTPNPEIQIPATGSRHARYSDELKGQVVAACHAQGVSLFATMKLWHLNLRTWLTAYLQACADNVTLQTI